MKVLCSGEVFDHPIEHIECLFCCMSRNGCPPCHLPYPWLKAIFLDAKEDRSKEIHVTDLTSCLRKSYWSKVDQKPEYVHDKISRTIGKAIHAYCERALEDDLEVESEVPCSDVRTGVVGRADVVFGEHVHDLKTTRWLDGTKLPYGEHSTQVNMYAAMLALEGEPYINYIDVSGPPTCTKWGCKRHKMPMRLIDGIVQCPDCGTTDKKGHLGSLIIQVDKLNTEDVLLDMEDRAGMLRVAIDEGHQPVAEPGWICKYCSVATCEHNPDYHNYD